MGDVALLEMDVVDEILLLVSLLLGNFFTDGAEAVEDFLELGLITGPMMMVPARNQCN